jgi:hypothetical protein
MTGFLAFGQYLKKYGLLAAWVSGAGLALPLAAKRAQLTPPWPEQGIVFATALLELVALAAVYQISQQPRRQTLRKICFYALGALCIVTVAYFATMAFLVFQIDHEVLVRGLICRPEAKLVYGSDCPLLTIDQIRKAENNPQVLWTMSSIVTSRLLLLSLWSLTYVLLALFLGTFIVIRQGRRSSKKIQARFSHDIGEER